MSAMLTLSQESAISNSISLIPYFKMIVIKGASFVGKDTVCREMFKRLDAVVEPFDLCELCNRVTEPLTNQHVVTYLDHLQYSVQKRVPGRHKYGIIYIRDYNLVTDVMMNTNSRLRHLMQLAIDTFAQKSHDNIRLVMTTTYSMNPKTYYWRLDLGVTREDMHMFLDSYALSAECVKKIMDVSKLVPIGQIQYSLKYALAMTKSDSDSFIEMYKSALSVFNGSSVDVDEDIVNPLLDELIGMDDIMDEIKASVVNPMKLAIPGISIKKGLLLCGPPGTGKTSVGRWLAHQIKGKFYLVQGSTPIDIVSSFMDNMVIAGNNAPGVVFIDDCDSLFQNETTYRSFLTILDGIETSKRSDVCVILTCMNMKTIPASLLRGGRLEMALITRLPDLKKIALILSKSLHKMINIVTDYDANLGTLINNQVSNKVVTSISSKMAQWNCADIHRCVNDVSRHIISGNTDMLQLFDKCIHQIREQYELCGKCDSTNTENIAHESYII